MAYENTGQQAFKIIQERYVDDNTLTGFQMPNVQLISPEAIVPNTATITYNYPTDVAPTGGANGDVWYNPVADKLYKKVSGVWSLLTDRVVNANYVPSVQNLSTCPLPI